MKGRGEAPAQDHTKQGEKEMKGKVILGVGLAVVALSVLAVLAVSGPAFLYNAQAQVTDEVLPEQVVTGFYDWYLGAIDLQAGRNPLVDRAYRSSQFLSEDFVARVDDLLDSFERGGYDPFLLAQDVPTEVEVGEAVVSGDIAQVLVETSFEGHAILVTLRRVNGVWKIDDVGVTPDVIVGSLYDRYLAYIDKDGAAMRNPLVDGVYREYPELSEAFVATVDEAIASFDKGGFDPILLAQDVPVKVVVGEAALSGTEASVPVELFWGGNPVPSERIVTLSLIDGAWKITGVGF
jgi:hypothetical protein